MRSTRKVAVGFSILAAATMTYLLVNLAWAHISIRREGAPLPPLESIDLARFSGDAPVGLSWINSASQAMSADAVLSHPSFVLRWRDGRLLLIDLGMTEAGAVSFGRPFEWLLGAEPIEFHGAVADQLGDARERVAGLVFTHLHIDHVDGVKALCEGSAAPVKLFMTAAQAERPNYLTTEGLGLLDNAGCVDKQVLEDAPLMRLDGFPGVYVFHAAGHTPGSQLILAVVDGDRGRRLIAFTGDITNELRSIENNVAKPWVYGALIVPESGSRQSDLRPFLLSLRERAGFELLVSHDERSLQAVLGPAGDGT
jgi:glyoxylase-like metal-dependent hydrolase (beta-lactamase superfamily II)